MTIHLGEVLTTKDRLARSLSWVTSFPLPHDSLGVGVRGFGQVVTQPHQFTGPIYQHAIGTFNAYSRGLAHRSSTLEVLTFHIILPALPNQRSPLST
jgi:hypothetical protein